MTSNSPDNSSLDSLLDAYEASRREGRTVSPEELCEGDPQLLRQLEEQLAKLQQMDQFLETIKLENVTGEGDPDAVNPLPPSGVRPLPSHIGRYRVEELLGNGGVRCRLPSP